MAFSSGKGLCKPYSGGGTPFLLILFGCGYAALGNSQKLQAIGQAKQNSRDG
jgi:hypothetical protein